MERVVRRWPPKPGDFTAEAVASLRALPHTADGPLLLGYLPAYFTNPYQALLYSAAREHGIAPVPMLQSSQLAELTALATTGLDTVVHLHWLHVLKGEAQTEAEARDRYAAFLAELDAYVAVGGRVVWTVHNVLPHDARFESVEAWFAGEVARRAAAIHVMASNTASLVAPYYELPPERVFVVPHPGFGRTYADSVSRLDARSELGIDPDEVVAAVVGAIRPYKGIDDVLDAWAQFDPGRPRRLVIAGAPAKHPSIAAVLERAAQDPTVVLDARRLDPDELQIYLRAADVAIFPYRRALNSSALLLALTFGLPVIVPEGGGLEELVESAYARTFVAGDQDSLVNAMRAIPEIATPKARTAAAAAAARLDPVELSQRFVKALRATLGGGERSEG